MTWVQVYITLAYITLYGQCHVYDSYGAKYLTLAKCGKDLAIPASRTISKSQEQTQLDCARKCERMFEGCGWFDATVDNCELGVAPRDVSCTDLEPRSGTTFYLKVSLSR
jgi:hypothetical protein